MNYTTQNKSSYSLLPLETTLLQKQSSERESYLPPINKLQLVLMRNRFFIKSIDDNYKHLRMILFGVLIYAYTQKPELLNEIKVIIYGVSETGNSSFNDSKIVKVINEVPFNQGEDTQKAVIDLFSDLTDMQILSAFLKLFQQKGYQRLEQCQRTISEYLKINISILNSSDEQNGEICLFLDDGILLKTSLQNAQGISLDSNLASPTSSVINSQSKSRKKQLIDLSITKAAIRASCDQQDHIEQQPHILRPIPVPSSQFKKQSQPFSLWDYLCC